MMNYTETLDYLYSQLPMFQRTGSAALKNNLDNTLSLDRMFNHPHLKFKSIHVAGTNGKGSVSHILASVLQSAGYKVGLYTSPHLLDFRERIKVNGEMIDEDAVCRFVDAFQLKNKTYNIAPSFFELTMMMAFDYFAQEKVDFSIVEVGLGGRLDSTNIINAEVSVITNISLDHTNLLGKNIASIAVEKAGIIKKNTPVVIGQTHPESKDVFISKAAQMEAPISFADQQYKLERETENIQFMSDGEVIYGNLKSELKGLYQSKNICTALAVVRILESEVSGLSEQTIAEGLKNVVENTGLSGRWQQLGSSPKIICDTGHNQDGIKSIVHQLNMESFERLHVVFGVVNDKDLSLILPLMPGNASYYFTKANIDRALDEQILKSEAGKYQLEGVTYSCVAEAIQAATKAATKNDFIYIGGSTFIVAEALHFFK